VNITNIIKLVNFILDKEWSGNTFTPDQFNTVISFVNEEVFSEEYTKLIGISIQAGELQSRELISLIDDSLLSPFKKLYNTTGAGSISIPSDYKKKLSAKIEDADGKIRYIEWVSEMEMQRRAAIISRKNPFEYPYGLIREPVMVWVPKTVVDIDFIYLRQPLTPFIDWAVSNTTGDTILLEPGWYITNDTGTINIRNAGNTIIYSDVTYYTSVPAGTGVLARSIDPEYDQMYYIMLVNRILEKAGVRINDQAVVQYSQMEQKKGE